MKVSLIKEVIKVLLPTPSTLAKGILVRGQRRIRLTYAERCAARDILKILVCIPSPTSKIRTSLRIFRPRWTLYIGLYKTQHSFGLTQQVGSTKGSVTRNQ